MKYIAILSSVPFESDLVLAKLKYVRETVIAGKKVYQGKLFKKNILLMNSGICKVNAALSATALLENFPVRLIINSGIGGSYPDSGLKIGDIAIATKEICGDEGIITPEGHEGLEKIGIPLVQDGKRKYFNEFPLDKTLIKKTYSIVTRHASRVTRVKAGNFVTVSATTGTRKRALELGKRFNAICENMEGAAVAQVCTIYRIPMLEMRGISNIAGIRDKRRWNIRLASENCQKAVLEIVSSI